MTPYDIKEGSMVGPAQDPLSKMDEVGIAGAPINVPSNNIIYHPNGNFDNNFYSIDAPFSTYYNQEVARYGELKNYYEENYIYRNGDHSKSYYNGILTNVIKDFDNDKMPEMAIFKIKTNEIDEYANKEIWLDMIEIVNGVAVLSDSMMISSELYLGEEIECDISIKRVNENFRIFLNYFDKRVREQEYESKFIALEYQDVLNVVSEINLSAREDDYYEDIWEYQDQVIDAGINVQDDIDIYRRAFLNDDMQVLPIFTIKRFNEKIKDGFVEDYFTEHFEDDIEDNIRLRYGYTTFMDRAEKG